jgi:hypothetical protein
MDYFLILCLRLWDSGHQKARPDPDSFHCIALLFRLSTVLPWDFAAGGELCDSAGKAGCPKERIAIGTEIETYEFMDVPQITGLTAVHYDRFYQTK